MRPLRLVLKNYRPFTEADIDLAAVQAATVTGPNGAGNSALAEAIPWALFGASRSAGPDGVVRAGATEASVQVDFEHEGREYRVIRKRSRGRRSELQYLVSDGGQRYRPLCGASMCQTQARIESDLGMDYALWRHSSCVAQGDSAAFCSATRAERKAVLYRVFEDRLGRFEPLLDAVRGKLRQIDQLAATNAARRAELSQEIEAKPIELEAREEALARLEQARLAQAAAQKELAALQAAMERIRADLDRLADVRRRLAKGEQELAQASRELESQRARCDALRQAAAEVESLRACTDEADSLELMLEGIREERDRFMALRAAADQIAQARSWAEEQARMIERVPCKDEARYVSTCPLLETAREARDRLQTLVPPDVPPFDDEQFTRLRERYAELRAAAAELPSALRAEAELEAAEALVESEARRVRSISADLDALGREEHEISTLTEGHEGIQEKLASARREAEASALTVERAASEVAIHTERLARIQRSELDLLDLEAQDSTLQQQRAVHLALERAFSRDGIPALVIDAALPAIEDAANEILTGLSDGRMRLKLATQRLKSSGGIAETLDIIVSDSDGERPYEDWSGGERLRIDLAIRVALGRVLAARTGASVRLLILDEVCAPLDQAGEDALVDCISRLAGEFSCVLLITHREALRDRLPQRITVLPGPDGASRLQVTT